MKELDNIKKYIEDKTLIKVKGLYLKRDIYKINEEIIVDINGEKGSISVDELDIQEENRKRFHDYIGKEFYVTIESIKNDKIYCSRKEAQEIIIKDKLKVGQEVEGIITNVLDYGVYLVIYNGMISSFLKNEELVSRGVNVSDVYKLGQSIKLNIVNLNNNKVMVQAKEKYSVCHNSYFDKIEEGEVIGGIVSNSNIDRIFVKIAPGLDVLCSAESGVYTNDKVDIEITKVDQEKKALRGKIVDINKVNSFIEKIEVGKLTKGVVKKINGNNFYTRIGTCAYVNCEIQNKPNIKVGSIISIKITNVDISTKEINGEYFDDDNIRNVLSNIQKGSTIKGTISYKSDACYIVDIGDEVNVLCRNYNNSLNINDNAIVDITSVNLEELSVKGIIIDNDKKEKYLSERFLGEELNGSITKIENNTCTVKVFVGVYMVCEIPKNIDINLNEQVKVKILDILNDVGKIKGEILGINTNQNKEICKDVVKDLNDYKRPFVVYGWETPNFTNKNRKVNTSAIYEMIHSGKISERDMSIIKFLMDCRFATGNQIHRFVDENIGRVNIANRLKKLVERRILNSFRLKEGNMLVYCIDIGGKIILDRYNNPKSKLWNYEKVNKAWNVIGKSLVSTEVYVRTKELDRSCEIEYNASPYIHEDIIERKSKQVVFSIKKSSKYDTFSILGEVYRKDDKENAFDKRIGNLEQYLEEKLWQKEFKKYNQPKIVIIVEGDDMIPWVNEKLRDSYPNIMKNLIITTDSNLDRDIFGINLDEEVI